MIQIYISMNELGNILKNHGDMNGAIEHYKDALMLIKQSHRSTYMKLEETSQVLINLASCEAQEPEAARKHLGHALTITSNIHGAGSPQAAEVQVQLAKVLERAGL